MKQTRYTYAANVIFFIHILLFIYALFGWLVPQSIWIYIGSLSAALFLDLYFGYCIVSKWEFDLRKKVNPSVDYPYNFSSYYTDKLFGSQLSQAFFTKAIYVFLFLSISINTFFALVG